MRANLMTEAYPYEITVNYETALFKRAAKANIQGIFLRNKNIVIPLLLIAACLTLILLVLIGGMLLTGCPMPQFGPVIQMLFYTLLTLVILLPLLYVRLYFLIIKNCEKLAKKMTNTHFKMAFGSEGFRLQSELANSEIRWKVFHKLQTGNDIWLLFPNAMTFYILPTELLSEELQGFVLDQLKENGVSIRYI